MKSVKRIFEKFGVALDPFIVLALFVIFLVPVITVLNLTPKYHKNTQPNVLGETDSQFVTIDANQTYAEGISVEKMTQEGDNHYTIYVKQDAHETGTYTNFLFTATNGTKEEATIVLSPVFEGAPDSTKYSVVLDEVKYVLRDENGDTYPPSIYLEPGKSVQLGLMIESPTNVNFTTRFAVEVGVE
jgi:hypothetical protein